MLVLVLVLVLALALAAAGCTPDLCGRTSDCAVGLVCTSAGVCAKPPVDAGTSGTDGATATPDAAVDSQPPIEGNAP